MRTYENFGHPVHDQANHTVDRSVSKNSGSDTGQPSTTCFEEVVETLCQLSQTKSGDKAALVAEMWQCVRKPLLQIISYLLSQLSWPGTPP